MSYVAGIEELEALYESALDTAVTKELTFLSDLHREYIEASPFVLVASVGSGGVDCSPRGDPAPVARVVDPHTVLLPDRRGNNRLDSLRNIVVDGRVGLLFMVPGVGVTLRVNGRARLSTDAELIASFAVESRMPRTVIEVTVESVYTQCPKALVRSDLWNAARHRDPADLPSVGRIMEWITKGEFDGEAHDAAYPERIRRTIY